MDIGHTMVEATKRHLSGRFVEAARLYTAVLEKDPRHADALHQMGLVCHQLGKAQDALQLIQQAIQVGQADRVGEYRVNLASLYNGLGQPERALRELDAARAANESKPMLTWYLQRAQAHRALEQTSESLGVLHSGLEKFPHEAKILHSMAVTLHEAGRLDEAVAAYRAVLVQSPLHSGSLLNLTQLHDDLRRPMEPEWIDRLTSASEATSSLLDRVRIEFAIAKSLDLNGSYERAWQHYVEANALQQELLRQQGKEFDATALSDWVDQLIAYYQASVVKSRPEFAQNSEKPIFIVGMPRTGSTLLEQMLLRHEEVGTVGESNRLSAAIGPDAERDPARLWNESASRLVEAAQSYLRWLDQRCPGKRRVINKLPWNVFHLGLIHMLFPNASVIYCCRDRPSTLVSCYTQSFTDPRTASICCDRQHLQRFWSDQDRLIQHWNRVLASPFLYTVEYGEWVSNPDVQFPKLLAHLQLSWSDRMLALPDEPVAVRTASVNQVREPIHTRSLMKWRRFEPWLQDWMVDSR